MIATIQAISTQVQRTYLKESFSNHIKTNLMEMDIYQTNRQFDRLLLLLIHIVYLIIQFNQNRQKMVNLLYKDTSKEANTKDIK